jgi:hypothetical protein
MQRTKLAAGGPARSSPERRRRPGGQSSAEGLQVASLLATFGASGGGSSRLTEGADVLLVLLEDDSECQQQQQASGEAALAALPCAAPASTYAASSTDCGDAGRQAAAASATSGSGAPAVAAALARALLRLPASAALWPWRLAASAAGAAVGAGLHAAGSLLRMAGALQQPAGSGGAEACADDEGAASSWAIMQLPAGHPPAASGRTTAAAAGCDAAAQRVHPGTSRGAVLRAHSQILALWSDRLARELQTAPVVAASAAAAAPPPRVELAASSAASPRSSAQRPGREGVELAPAADLPDGELPERPAAAAQEWVPLAAAVQPAATAAGCAADGLRDQAGGAGPITLHVGGEPGVGPATWALALGLMYPTRPLPDITWVGGCQLDGLACGLLGANGGSC